MQLAAYAIKRATHEELLSSSYIPDVANDCKCTFVHKSVTSNVQIF